MVALLLKSLAIEQVTQELLAQFGPHSENANFFDYDPLVLDFSQVQGNINWQAVAVLKKNIAACRLVLVGARGVPSSELTKLHELGLIEAPTDFARPSNKEPLAKTASTTQAIEAPTPTAPSTTLVIDKPLRSGQKVYARGGDLVVLAMVNPGAELIADGNIHVYAPLRGKAMAGARGNTQARIFSLCFEPELVSIAGVYRTSENPFSLDVRGKPTQVWLTSDGQEKLFIEALKT